MTKGPIILIPNVRAFQDESEEKNEDKEERERFNRMLEDFEHFVSNTSDYFGAAGFLHKMFDKVLERAYQDAYECIAKAKDPDPYICAATHLKECKDISDDIRENVSAAIGDMKRGDLNKDMSGDLQLLKQIKNMIGD